MLKLAISTLLLVFTVAALCDDSKFSFNGKLMKPNKDYQYPPKIKIAWFNVLEGSEGGRGGARGAMAPPIFCSASPRKLYK